MQGFSSSGFNSPPPVVKNLLIINFIMLGATYVLQERLDISLVKLLGFHYYSSEYFKPFQFITYMFMHGSIMHIFSNMFGLFMLGSTLESYWGSKKFFSYYMFTGIGAALVHMAFLGITFFRIDEAVNAFNLSPSPDGYLMILKDHFQTFYEIPQMKSEALHLAEEWKKNPDNVQYFTEAVTGQFAEMRAVLADIPTVGASGALFGILLAFGMLFPNAEMMMILFPIPIKAKYFVMLYGAFELYRGIQDSAGDNVAHYAHLGGMLFGFILIKFWNRNRYQSF